MNAWICTRQATDRDLETKKSECLDMRTAVDHDPAIDISLAKIISVIFSLAEMVSGVSIAQVSKMQTNPGVDFSGADYGVFASFHWLSSPTISQTLAAEALAISLEAPLGNAKDAAEERRPRRKGDNAKVRALRRRPSSWRRRKGRPWESIWGCSAVKEVLSNQSRGKPVQFPGALGLDSPCSSLYTAQIREEHAHCGSHGPLYLFDPCRLVLFLAYCAKGSNRSNFLWIQLLRWPRWEIASYLYGACKQVSEFLKLPSRQCSASRVLDYLLRFHSLPPRRVPVFQVPPVVRSIGLVKRKFHKVIGGMRCGPARR